MVQSVKLQMKNNLAPINRIPPEVFSTIPEYWSDEDTADEDLITATHVCRGWRDLFISSSSLWTQLNCTHVEKTRIYVERSKLSPLDISIRDKDTPFLSDAFLLTIPHLTRLRSLSIFGLSRNLVGVINQHLHYPAPSLEKLKISFVGAPRPIEGTTFDGDLSSLRDLRLSGVLTNLPWVNLPNLTTFYFRNVPSDKVSVTQLLDFFEHAPFLRNVTLTQASSTTSDAPLGRAVTLPHLKLLKISAQPVYSALLKHLSIPRGAVLILDFDFYGEISPIPICLPKPFDNLKNILPITSVNLLFDPVLSLRLNGPNGGLYIYGNWDGRSTSLPAIHRQGLRSLDHFPISSTERLTIRTYSVTPLQPVEDSATYKTLILMNALRTLTLIDCLNASFVSAFDPSQNPFGTLLCPALEELTLYVKKKGQFCMKELLAMTKERNLKGARLTTIKIISVKEFMSAEAVFKLRDWVTRVKYRLDNAVPAWDDDPDGIPHFEDDDDW